MSKTVFILGAGSSAEAGGPLMKDFLDKADSLWKGGEIENVGEKFDKVFKAISKLQAVYYKSYLDTQNIESVFAAFEMGKLLHKFFDLELTEINELIESMRTLILKTLEHSILFKFKDGLKPHPPHNNLVKLIKQLESLNPPLDSSVVTFNYDLTMDFALYWNQHNLGKSINYFTGESIHFEGGVSLLKLHGSLNWGWCDKCNKVIPVYFKDHLDRILNNAIHKYGKLKEKNLTILPFGSKISEIQHNCNNKGQIINLDSMPVIVPPTWNKTDHHNQLASVWQRAAKELGEAENIFVLGYSFPQTDSFFHYLYALGSIGSSSMKRFWVFDPSPKTVSVRFEKLIGSGIKDGFKILPTKFSEAIEALKTYFTTSRSIEEISEELIKARR